MLHTIHLNLQINHFKNEIKLTSLLHIFQCGHSSLLVCFCTNNLGPFVMREVGMLQLEEFQVLLDFLRLRVEKVVHCGNLEKPHEPIDFWLHTNKFQ